MTAFKHGAKVQWRWGVNIAEGTVDEVFRKPVSRTIKGKRIRRAASEKNPAYLVRQDDGAKALKSHSELERD